MKTAFAIPLVLVASLFAGPGPAAAVSSDRFVAGPTVTESAPVAGDLFAAGGSIDVDADVDGDAFLAAGKIRVGADVGQSLYGAAGHLSVLGAIARNARLAAGSVEITETARIGGNLSVAGGNIVVRGTIDGELSAAAGDLLIDGAITGDVDVAARSVALGPNARIGGTLRYRSAEPLARDASAQVLGTVERRGIDRPAAPSREETARREEIRRGFRLGFAIFWTVGVMLLAAAVVATIPRLSAAVSETLRTRVGASIVLGFIVLVCTPVAVLMLFATVVGIPLGLLLVLLYLMLLPLAWVGSAIGIGDRVLARVSPANATRTRWRIVGALLAAVALALVWRIPWVGSIMALAVLLAGLGAWTWQLRRLTTR